MTTEIERWWVERAQRMPHGRHAINRNEKNPHRYFPHLADPGLSFPGHLGAEYRPGEGVLVLANVHRNFDSGGMVGDPGGAMRRMVEATAQLQYGSVDPDAYLAAARSAYELALSPGGWTVGAHIYRVWQAALLDEPHNRRRMAYMNISCGQFPERTAGEPYPIEDADAQKIKKAMQTCCNSTHSVADVVGKLDPAVVICMSWRGENTLRRTGWTESVPVVYFHQWESRGLKLLRPVTLAGQRFEVGAAPEQWLPLLTRQLATSTPVPSGGLLHRQATYRPNCRAPVTR